MQEITKKLIDAGYRGKVFRYGDAILLCIDRHDRRQHKKISDAVKSNELIKLAAALREGGLYIINPRLKIEVLTSGDKIGYPATLYSYEDVHLISNHYIASRLCPGRSYGAQSYITSVTALAWHNWIPESVHIEISATHEGSHPVKKISNALGTFEYYKPPFTDTNAMKFYMEPMRLLDDCIPIYNSNPEDDEPDYYVANHLRAIADMVYINKINPKPSNAASLQAFEYNDPLSYLTDSMRIELEDLESLTSEDFDRETSAYKSTRVLEFLKRLREQLKK